jgi:Transposase
LLGEGSKADKPDARKLADLLRAGLLRPVYHGHEATRQLKELVRGYETLSADTQRMMVRIKAIYRGHGIRTPGSAVISRNSGNNGWNCSPSLEADSV